ncbi:MAG: BTAD domain-containing putative transcriptional regulator [Gemmatimonadaceae bacterium]
MRSPRSARTWQSWTVHVYVRHMFRLSTLGTFGLFDASGADTSLPPHRLALLALLAASGDRGMARDKILAYLWPDATAAKARAALEQMLHALRVSLDDRSILLGNPLRLDPAVVSSDVGDFRNAITAGDHARAAALYEGPFLDGFYLSEVPEFERWVTTERSRLEAQYVSALEKLAIESAARGEHARAMEWVRSLGSVALATTTRARHFMEALAASGDRDSALEFAAIHAARIRTELGTEPDASVAALAEQLRAGHHVVRTVQASSDEKLPVQGAAPRRKRIVAFGVTAAVAAVILLFGGWAWFSRSNGARLDPNVIAVMPFRVNASDSSYNYLREGIVDLMNAHLTGDGVPRAVDSRTLLIAWRRVAGVRSELTEHESTALARQLGAQKLLLGSLVFSSEGSVLTASLRDARSGREIMPYKSERTNDELRLVADLTRALMVHTVNLNDVRSPGLSDSLEAIKEYLSGLRASRSNQWLDAYEHYSRAVKVDSAFPLAALRVYEAAAADFGPAPPGPSVLEPLWKRVWSLRHRLSARDTLLLRSMGAFYLYPDRASAAGVRELAVRAAPDDPRVWTNWGISRAYAESPTTPESNRTAAMILDSAIALDPSNAIAVQARLYVALRQRDSTEIRKYNAMHNDVGGAGQDVDGWRWAAAHALSDTRSLDSVRTRAHEVSDESIRTMVYLALNEGFPLDDPAALLSRRLSHPMRDAALRRRDFLWLFETAVARGQARYALDLADSASRDSVLRVPFAERVIRQALHEPGTGYDSVAAAAARFVGGLPLERAGRSAYCLTQIWHAVSANQKGARAAAAELRAMADTSSVPALRATRGGICPHFLEGLEKVGASSQVPVSLVRRIDSILARGLYWDRAAATTNVLLSRWQERRGDLLGALATIRRRSRGLLDYQMAGRAAMARSEGKLAALVGDTAGAIRAYAHYLTLRDKPDPGPMAKEVAEVRTHLAQLQRASRR